MKPRGKGAGFLKRARGIGGTAVLGFGLLGNAQKIRANEPTMPLPPSNLRIVQVEANQRIYHIKKPLPPTGLRIVQSENSQTTNAPGKSPSANTNKIAKPKIKEK